MYIKKTIRVKGNPEFTKEFCDKLADKLLEFITPDNKVFWIKDFAIANKFPAEYLWKFAQLSDKFNNAYKLAKDIQESKLVKLGLSKSANAAFVIFALKNVAGWRDSVSHEHTILNIQEAKQELQQIFENKKLTEEIKKPKK